MKELETNKSAICHANDIPGRAKWQIQLIASQTVKLEVSDYTKIGTDQLNNEHLFLISNNGVDEVGIQNPE